MTFQTETHAFISTLLKLFLLAGTLKLPSQRNVTRRRLEVHQHILEGKRSHLSAGAGDKKKKDSFNLGLPVSRGGKS